MWLSCVLSVGIVCNMCGCSQGVGISVAAHIFALRGGLLHECAALCVSFGMFVCLFWHVCISLLACMCVSFGMRVYLFCHMYGSLLSLIFALLRGLLRECAAQVSVGLFCLRPRSLLLYM